MSAIDARAIVDPDARLGNDVEVGPWSVIGPGVEIGDGCRIGTHAIVKGPTRMGAGNRVFQFATIGEDTPALAYKGEPTALEIGANNVFREGVTVHRGMVQGRGKTVVGNDGLFMAYVHIGHDCRVGDHVIMANNASVAGHCTVGDHANFGGYAGVPQFRYVGAHSHIAAMSLVLKDVPDYVMVAGNPACAVGMNAEGLRRRGSSVETVNGLKEAFRVVFRLGLTVDEACERLRADFPDSAEIGRFVASIRASEVGIVRPRPGRPE